jgi:predicted ribosome quality control (RQC) complex YloA/Tae2 family protein
VSLSDAEIADVVAELAPRLSGGQVGKAWLRDADTLVLEIGRERLLLSTHPRASRLHLETSKPRRASGAGTGAGTGAAAPPFAMLLRKRIGGHRLQALEALPDERLVTLGFGAGRDRLVAELTGPHANLFLVSPAGLIAGALHRSTSTTRVLSVGHEYRLPPPAPAGALWRGRRRFTSPHPADEVAAHYAAFLAAEEERQLRERIAAALRRDLVRVGRRERALREDLTRIAQAAHHRKLGDLLLAHAATLPGRGATSVTVPDDFEDGAPITIATDPALDARENAARHYRQHRRLAAGRKHADARLAATLSELRDLEARLQALPTLPLEALRRLASHRPAGRTSQRRPAEERLPYREYRSLAGDAIWVGRSAADNDALSFRHARGNDLWLHSRDAPGAHVVVPLRSGKPVSEATFLDAATLAAHFSPLAGEAQVDVSYTAVKNLRKPRGAAPGLVFTADAKTIRVRLEPVRLERLLARPPDEL